MSKPAVQPALNPRAGGGAARALRPQRMWGGKAPAQRRGLQVCTLCPGIPARLQPSPATSAGSILPSLPAQNAASSRSRHYGSLLGPGSPGTCRRDRPPARGSPQRQQPVQALRASAGRGRQRRRRPGQAVRGLQAADESAGGLQPQRQHRSAAQVRALPPPPPLARHPSAAQPPPPYHRPAPCTCCLLACAPALFSCPASTSAPSSLRHLTAPARSPSRRRSGCRPANPSPLPLTPRPRGCRRFSQQQRGGWNDGATADKVRRTEARVLNAWTSERGMQAAAAGTVLLVVALLVAAGGPPADARCTLPWC